MTDLPNKIQKFLISPTKTVLEAIRQIDESKGQIVIVIDDSCKLLGIVTDGDIRRYILQGNNLDKSVTEVMNTNPLVVHKDTSRDKIIQLMREKRLRHFPMIDDNRRLVNLITLDWILNVEIKENPIVIMAGGKGKRLRPLTETCPKPMLKVGDRPMLEIIIERFANQGFKNIFISLNYKGEMIREHFGNGSSHGVEIRYLDETKPLGTAGSLTLLPKNFDLPMLVMNGDVLTNVNFNHLLSFHKEHESAATMCVREHQYEIPYGVIDFEEDSFKIKKIREKPTETQFVNAGLYVLAPQAVDLIPTNKFFDMPSLFDELIKLDKTTSVFPIHEYWRDIGQFDDFEQANSDFDTHFGNDN